MSCLSLAASDSGVDDDVDTVEAVDSSFSSSFRLIMDGDVLSSSSGVGDRCLGAMLVLPTMTKFAPRKSLCHPLSSKNLNISSL